MTVRTWKRLAKAARFIKYRVNWQVGVIMQDKLDDLYNSLRRV